MPTSIQRLFTSILLTCLCATAPAAETPADTASAQRRALQAACLPDAPTTAAIAGVQVRAAAADTGDLPFVEASSRASGGTVRIYHDPGLADAALSKAACFMGMLDLLPAAIPGTRTDIAWAPMVISRNAQYIPPRVKGRERWLNVFTSDNWRAPNLLFLLSLMPHEETHHVQGLGRDRLARWFSEGHAEWVALQVTEQIRPDLARSQLAGRANDLRKAGKVHLGSWGGLRVKPEAIERQLSAQDRARRAKDPGYMPPGPFNFGPDDLEADMGNEAARYGAALALFDGLEARHGRAAVQRWVRAVLDAPGKADIAALARSTLGEDIAPLLE
jgi:hypothetical protein